MSSNNSNKIMVPNAREAMNKFKMEAANEVGVNLKQGYNGDLTSKQAGSVGGQMEMCIRDRHRAVSRLPDLHFDPLPSLDGSTHAA